jgi:peroxiredoxin
LSKRKRNQSIINIYEEVTVAAQEVAKEIAVGDTAPDFTLKDQDQKDVTLSSFKGKKHVVLAFYPLDWSPVCTGENKCLTDDFPKFDGLNAVVFGISTDSFFSHKAWADSLELKQQLLADFTRDVVKQYGLYFEPLNCGKRATVIVDKNGKVAYVKVQEIKVARDDKDILDALKKLN